MDVFQKLRILPIWLKVFLSREYRMQSEVALIDAARGVLYSRHSSPNTSPGTYFFKKVVFVSPFKLVFKNMVTL